MKAAPRQTDADDELVAFYNDAAAHGGNRIKLVSRHAPIVYVTVTLNFDVRFVSVEHARKNREGMKYEPSTRFSLVVEDDWIYLSRDDKRISEDEFAAFLIEHFA